MFNLINWLASLTHKETAEDIAREQLREARVKLLFEQSQKESAEANVKKLNARIARLEAYSKV